MFDKLFSDFSFTVAKRALDGLTLRRDVLAQNVANVDTPEYKAKEVNFEATLQQAMRGERRMPMATTHVGHQAASASDPSDLYQAGLRKGGSTRADGNNVDIDQELLQMAETGVRYQALTSVVSKKLNLLKTISQAR